MNTARDGNENTRRELLKQYVQLQHDIMEADPSSSTYQVTVRAFRQMGHMLMTAGFEEDLDRLLRFRVIEGGRPRRAHPPNSPADEPILHVIERRVK